MKRKLLGLTCVGSSPPTIKRIIEEKILQFCQRTYLFWRRAGHQRCFSPTWLRRAEAPRLWASSMTPHGSCPGGAPVTATWKIDRGHTIYTSTNIKRDKYKPKLCCILVNLQTYSTSSLLLSFCLSCSMLGICESVKLLLSESEAHRRFDDFSALIAILFFCYCVKVSLLLFCFVFIFCVRDRERGTFLISLAWSQRSNKVTNELQSIHLMMMV